jgi:hypothetical protein
MQDKHETQGLSVPAAPRMPPAQHAVLSDHLLHSIIAQSSARHHSSALGHAGHASRYATASLSVVHASTPTWAVDWADGGALQALEAGLFHQQCCNSLRALTTHVGNDCRNTDTGNTPAAAIVSALHAQTVRPVMAHAIPP